jgi:hypothetical protein
MWWVQKINSKTVLVLAAVGIGLCISYLIFALWKPSGRSRQRLESQKSAVPDIPNTFYVKTVPISEEVRAHLLDGDFKIAIRVTEIPDTCSQIFFSSFTTVSGSPAKGGEVGLADPGGPFQASDYIQNPDLPFRRLEFAGSGTKCFVHYQSGGEPSSFCLAVIDYGTRKNVWVGEYERAAENLDELRQMISQHRFRETLGRGC